MPDDVFGPGAGLKAERAERLRFFRPDFRQVFFIEQAGLDVGGGDPAVRPVDQGQVSAGLFDQCRMALAQPAAAVCVMNVPDVLDDRDMCVTANQAVEAPGFDGLPDGVFEIADQAERALSLPAQDFCKRTGFGRFGLNARPHRVKAVQDKIAESRERPADQSVVKLVAVHDKIAQPLCRLMNKAVAQF